MDVDKTGTKIKGVTTIVNMRSLNLKSLQTGEAVELLRTSEALELS